MKLNPLSTPDGYKHGHVFMYRPGTKMIYSNFTPRSNHLFKGSSLYDGKMTVWGVRGFVREVLIEMFDDGFFEQPKEKVVARYRRRMNAYVGKNVVTTKHIEALHDLGYLPLCVKALPEGTRVNMKIPMMVIYNTHHDFAWLVNFLETVWSNMVWKSCVNASLAFEYRQICEKYAEETGAPKDAVVWQVHDFACRGMSGMEDAARSNSGHLLYFHGTDTVVAIDYLEDYYGADCEEGILAGSVFATEHSVSSSNILFHERETGDKLQAEIKFMDDFISRIVPTGIASYVADTYDYWGVLTEVLPALKDKIMARDGKLVIRPDSGDPVKVICGYKLPECLSFKTIDDFHTYLSMFGTTRLDNSEAVKIGNKYYELVGALGSEVGPEITEHEAKGSIQLLWELFGGSETSKGYKMLDQHIGLIYGDSITLERAETILERLKDKGFASTNVVFGAGSFTYNYSTRDTFGSAVKATATMVDGEFIELYKDPKTAQGKKSARGLLRVDREGYDYVLTDQVCDIEEIGGELKLVFINGFEHNVDDFDTIRTRANSYFSN